MALSLTIHTKCRTGPRTEVACPPESKQKFHVYQHPEGKGQMNPSKHTYIVKNCLPRKHSAHPSVSL